MKAAAAAINDLPILYTFRRCPYAIRARMALAHAGVAIQLREVLLRDKPQAMLDASAKGTVPVLVLPHGEVIDESLDVMRWAQTQTQTQTQTEAPWPAPDDAAERLITENDGPFKEWLDKYKYADRHPEHPAPWYRAQAEPFLARLDQALKHQPWLAGATPGFVDVAVFPFIRQFAGVDRAWFDQSQYLALRAWLQRWLDSELFSGVMAKHPMWSPGDARVIWGDYQGVAVEVRQ